MLQMDFLSFNVESIRGFTSTFSAIRFATSYHFGFPPRSKRLPLNILNFLVTILGNQDKKVAFIWVDKYWALARSSKFTKICHNMKSIVQNTGRDASSLNEKIEIPNRTLANITINLLLSSSHTKELWLLAYKYAIWISCWTENILRCDVCYFFWNWSGPLHQQIKTWGVMGAA